MKALAKSDLESPLLLRNGIFYRSAIEARRESFAKTTQLYQEDRRQKKGLAAGQEGSLPNDQEKDMREPSARSVCVIQR
jgi:hypothetical protein